MYSHASFRGADHFMFTTNHTGMGNEKRDKCWSLSLFVAHESWRRTQVHRERVECLPAVALWPWQLSIVHISCFSNEDVSWNDYLRPCNILLVKYRLRTETDDLCPQRHQSNSLHSYDNIAAKNGFPVVWGVSCVKRGDRTHIRLFRKGEATRHTHAPLAQRTS